MVVSPMVQQRLYGKSRSMTRGNQRIEPTIEQLKAFYSLCVRVSNLLRTVELTRYDTRSQRIVVLIGRTIEVEILSNGEVLTR